jgi:hypothetical protein
MIIYISRDLSEEFAVCGQDGDSEFYECQAELPDEEYEKLKKVNKAYWDWQSRLYGLYEKSPRRDKR